VARDASRQVSFTYCRESARFGDVSS